MLGPGLGLCGAIAVASPAMAGGLSFVFAGEAGEPVSAVRWQASTVERLRLHPVAGRVGAETWSCAGDWTFHLATPRLFGWPSVPTAEQCAAGAPLEVAWAPGGSGVGKLGGQAARGISTLRVEGRHCHGTAPEPRRTFEIPVQVAADGGFAVPLPAGCVDLGLSAEGSARVLRTGLRVAAGGQMQLGSIELVAGTTVVARLAASWSGQPLSGVRAAVVPEDRWEVLAARALAGEALPIWRGLPSDDDGLLRLEDLEAGRFGLIFASDLPSVSRLAVAPMQLAPGATVDLGVLRLDPAAELYVEVARPVAGAHEALGDGWRLDLVLVRAGAREADPAMAARALELSGQGSVHVPVAPGAWQLELQLVSKHGHSLPIEVQAVEVAPGEAATVRFARWPVNVFVGRTVARGEAVRADLQLAPERIDLADGTPARLDRGFVAPTARTDEEGRFLLALEHPGTYTARVTWSPSEEGDDRVTSVLPGVVFDDPASEVLVRVPTGAIRGTVLDATGQPAPGVLVEAVRRVEPEAGGERRAPLVHAARQTDERGGFALEGLLDGEWAIQARREDYASAVQKLALATDAELVGVSLRLEAMRRLRGEVRTGLGPLGEASGQLLLGPSSRLPYGDVVPFQTDRDGRFDLALPVETPAGPGLLMLYAAGRLAAARWVTLDGETEQVVLADAGGGVLELRPAGESGWPAAFFPANVVLLARDGSGLWAVPPSEAALAPGVGSSQPLRLVGLEPGAWRVAMVRGLADVALLATGGGNHLPVLAEVEIRPGEQSTVVLDLGTAPARP
jgi:hypothetical protein